MRLIIFGAIVLAAAVAFGTWQDTGAEYPPHCDGVSLEEALYVVGRMNEARQSHEFWARPENNQPWSGDIPWHLNWIDTYWRTNNLLALTLRGCV